jgi:hypothetical protein
MNHRKTLRVMVVIGVLVTSAFGTAVQALATDVQGGCGYYYCPPAPGGGGGGGGGGDQGDDRINPGHGDDVAVLRNGLDSYNYPSLDIWCMNNGASFLAAGLSQYDFKNYPAQPAQDTLVKATELCGQKVEVWVLTTGEYQVNIHRPDGTTAVVIFTSLPATDIYFYDIRP